MRKIDNLNHFKKKFLASKDLTPIVNQLVECTGVHPMTPSFIHTLFFSPPSNEPQFDSMLLCGLENGLCLAFDPSSLMLCAFKQIGYITLHFLLKVENVLIYIDLKRL